MKRLLILAALTAGLLVTSFPSDASAGWRRAYRRGYYGGYYRGYGYGYPGYYGRPRVIVQAPGVQLGYGGGYYPNAGYPGGYYGSPYYGYGW